MRRCLYTANITFGGLELPVARPFTPTIKEFLREGISIHTCDSRSNRTHISSLFPTWEFEPGFPEQDLYWNGVTGGDLRFDGAVEGISAINRHISVLYIIID